MKGVVYILEFASGKSYIGITRQPLKNRLKGHRFDALQRQSNLPVHKAWRAHGEPTVKIVYEAPVEQLCDLEVKAISEFKTLKPNGYNLSPGGEIPPATIPGVPEKISKAARERGIKPEHRGAMQAAQRVAMRDPEVRKRMSIAQKGRVVSEATRTKMREKMVGRKLTDEHRQKLKDARGKRAPVSAETRQKMSESHKLRRINGANNAMA